MEAIVVIPANTRADVRNAFYKEYKLRGYKAKEGEALDIHATMPVIVGTMSLALIQRSLSMVPVTQHY